MSRRAAEIHLLDYWPVLLRRRWVVYLSVIVCALAALIGSLVVTPLYRATTTLQIERQNPDVLTFSDLSKIDYSWAAYSDFYQTQYRIIASLPVATEAASRLGLDAHPLVAGSGPSRGLFARLKSLLPARRAEVEPDPLDAAAATVLAGLEVSPVRDSQLVQISWVSSDAALAAGVANAVADAYIRHNIGSQFRTTDQAREFLLNQIGELKRELAEQEAELQSYGESKGILSVDGSENITLQSLKGIAERRTEARTALALKEAAFRAASETPPEALPEVAASSLIARLLGEYAAYEVEYSEQSKRFKPDWPGLQVLAAKLEQARARLEVESERIATQVRAAAEAEYQGARKELEQLDALLQAQELEAQQLKRDAVEYIGLQSDVEKKRETLNALIQRHNEMDVSSRLMDLEKPTLNIRIMEEARVPTAPFKPRTPVNLVLGLIAGLTLGVGLAFFLDYLDNTIGSVAEMEQVLALPILASIPRHGVGQARSRRRPPVAAAETVDLIAHRDGQSRAAEAYRELRTSLLLSNPGHQPRLIMITSALPEEGKTATALNLAVVLAQLERRVLIVDTDLRRPRLHKAFGVSNERGVSTYLAGLATDARSLVSPTGIERLDLLASGPIPPNPSELLNSDIFNRLGPELLDRGYDHILFDSPPVLSVSDPVIISHGVEARVLVVRAGRTPRQSVRAAADKLRQGGTGSVGLVLNALERDSHGADRYDYYYSRRDDEGGEAPTADDRRARRARA